MASTPRALLAAASRGPFRGLLQLIFQSAGPSDVGLTGKRIKALFRSNFFFLNFDIVALSFLFDKHCPIIK